MENQTSHLTILCGRLINLSAVASIEIRFKACTLTPKGNEKFDVKFVCILIIQAKYYNDREAIKVSIERTMTKKELTTKFPDIVLHFKDLSKLKLNEEVEICYLHKCLLTEKQRHRILTNIQKELPTGLEKQNLRNIMGIII